uniref:Putative dna-binding protein n=1 Tax=Anopheles triannulatus TaxID=58253 RepID=A0A2M4AUG5_9DIPT
MVLADRTAENVRNGRRSRGPSPNGHSGTVQSAVATAGGAAAPGGMATDTSSDEENSRKNGNTSKATKAKSEYEEKIRVGRDYQAVCPELIPQPDRKPEALNDRALLVWSPTKDIPDNKLEEYITLAKERYGYNGEQALGMLFWHKHNLERALMDLANFTPFPDEWTAEDRVLFEQAFQFHGKSFHRIRQMLPDKTIASLVKFYYSWKKTRSRTSVMDRQEKLKKNDSSENGSDHGSNEESDNEDKIDLVDDENNRVTVTSASEASVADPETPPNGVSKPAKEEEALPEIECAADIKASVTINSSSATKQEQQQEQQQQQQPVATENASSDTNSLTPMDVDEVTIIKADDDGDVVTESSTANDNTIIIQ